jgi:hypothetical protein
MPERRKSPRYPVHLPVYFPGEKQWGYTANLSLDGCYVVVRTSISEGLITDMLLELPVVGAVSLKGYVQHKKDEVPGIGLQFVQVRFAADQSEYFNLYSRFLRMMPELEEIRGDYLALVQEGRLKLCSLPRVRPTSQEIVYGEKAPEKDRQ